MNDDSELPMSRLRLTRVQTRVSERAAEIIDEDPSGILFQHSVLCQVYLPYRDPKDATHWVRQNGNISLFAQAGMILDPRDNKPRVVGIPFGAKSRLVLAHLNTRALQGGSNVIRLEEESFTQFVKSMQDPLHDRGAAPNGREIRAYKEQLTRFSTVQMTLAFRVSPELAQHRNRRIVEDFDICCFAPNDKQRLLWPESITLSQDYWQGLQQHAVPLDTRALAALAHNPLALDVYQWLAQRLHRIKPGDDQPLTRAALHAQFGQGYAEVRVFWRKFKLALGQVLTVYQGAKVYEQVGGAGLVLHHSQPPVARRLQPVPNALRLPRGKR